VVIIVIVIAVLLIIKFPRWYVRYMSEIELWDLRGDVYDSCNDEEIPENNETVQKLLDNLRLYAESVAKLSIAKLIIMRALLRQSPKYKRIQMRNSDIRLITVPLSNSLYTREAQTITDFLEERDKIVLDSIRYGSWVGLLIQVFIPRYIINIERSSVILAWFASQERKKESSRLEEVFKLDL